MMYEALPGYRGFLTHGYQDSDPNRVRHDSRIQRCDTLVVHVSGVLYCTFPICFTGASGKQQRDMDSGQRTDRSGRVSLM